MDKDLKDKTLTELEQIVAGLGQPFDSFDYAPFDCARDRQDRFAQGGERAKRVEPKKYLAEYIFGFIHAKGVGEISQITPLSKALRAQLAEQGYFISQFKILRKLTDPDGTIKYLFELSDGNRIETVLLPDDERQTLCISTQVGCAMNCAFCATAKVKLQRNLTAAEIIDQVNVVQTEDGRVGNIVYMGMGEPLLNYDAVVKSVRILNDPAGKNIGIRHITISTCGIVPAIKKLADEEIRPRLAISLNAPTDALRMKLMPVGAKYSIADLIEAAKFYQLKAKQRVTFEYVLIKGVNDTVLHAQMLAKLLKNARCRVNPPHGRRINPPHEWRVNLIEFNPHRFCELEASGSERIQKFAAVLEKAGIRTTTRFKMGRSINAACGQLGADRSIA